MCGSQQAVACADIFAQKVLQRWKQTKSLGKILDVETSKTPQRSDIHQHLLFNKQFYVY